MSCPGSFSVKASISETHSNQQNGLDYSEGRNMHLLSCLVFIAMKRNKLLKINFKRVHVALYTLISFVFSKRSVEILIE